MYTLEYRKNKSKLSVSDDHSYCQKVLLNGELQWDCMKAVTSQSDIYIQPYELINPNTYTMEYIKNSMVFHDFFHEKLDQVHEEVLFHVCHQCMDTLWEHRKVIVDLQPKFDGIDHTDMTTYNLLVNLDDYNVKIMDIDSIRTTRGNRKGAMTDKYKSTLNTCIHMQDLVAERRKK